MGYQQIGDILIFNKLSKIEASKFLEKIPRIKTICVRIGTIKGKLRKPQLKVLASCIKNKSKRTETIHKENGILYKIDVAKLMFAKGNINERHRIAKEAKKNEIVIDMFSGIGYFSLPLAKKVKSVYAIELNPVAYRYLLENIKLNKIKNIKAFYGDCTKVILRLAKLKFKADRIVMGLLPSPFKYLEAAFKVAKKGAIIHYSCLISKKEKVEDINRLINRINLTASQNSFKIKLLKAVSVKGYSPSKEHYVLDLRTI